MKKPKWKEFFEWKEHQWAAGCQDFNICVIRVPKGERGQKVLEENGPISPKDNETYKCTGPKCLRKLNKIMKKTALRHRIIITLKISANRKI